MATAAYAPEPAAVGAARRFVRDTLRAWELAGPAWGQLVDDAVLLTSELVTNAVLHAGTPVQVTCRLLVDAGGQRTGDQLRPAQDQGGRAGGTAGSRGGRDGGGGDGTSDGKGDGSGGAVEIVVLDRRPAQLRPALPYTSADVAERVSGRGLQLQSELASAWGVTYAREAKAVWFRMVLPRRENAQRGAPVHAGCRAPG